MDHLLRLLRGTGLAAIFRFHIVLWHGLCWNSRHGMGMDHCHDFHPVRGYGHGYDIQACLSAMLTDSS